MPTREELKAELKELEAANEAATSWGAAVGARYERIKAIKRSLAAPSPSQAEKAHKVMTPEEYVASNIQGWHSVCRDYDNAGNVAVRYGAQSPPVSNVALDLAKKSIMAALIGSCECNTKTPDAAFHAGHCRYLKLLAALDHLDDASVTRDDDKGAA